uniref:BV6 family protein n=1 Tax=Microplitis mediator bracovirus TaxID=1836595 RepID=A0A1D5APK3_9VIRU|nr:hypothetical protein A6F54_82 [Microplitis mediator bracovirus]
MSSKHVCLVPNEWGTYYASDTLEVILKKEISCNQITKKVEGIGINVEGVTAHLRYHKEQPWMRKDQDKRTWPNHREYFGVYLSCNDCREPLIYLLPREWLAISWNELSYVLFNEISSEYRKYKTINGMQINIEGVKAYLLHNNEEFWLRKCQDPRDKPDPKEYYSVFMPCIYCTDPNKPLYRRN